MTQVCPITHMPSLVQGYKGQHRTVCGCAADDKADDKHKDDADARRQAQGRAVYKDEQYYIREQSAHARA